MFLHYKFHNNTMGKTIKQRLVDEINQSGMTTIELARKAGVTPNMISQYRHTKKMPSLETFALLCMAIDASADYILGLKKS